jgi:dTDP-4-amino-4,6-dideoxygalactose transaminase
VESLITKKTKAVLATHIYGNVGDIEKLEEICKENKIRLIFDAAHAFAVKYKNKSILEYGDISVLSFHATKVYHTVEGGAIYCKDKLLDDKMRLKRNFGYDNFKVTEIGINSKISEYHSAMGLIVLDEIEKIINNRKQIFEFYNLKLKNCISDKKINNINLNPNIKWNYSYYPILLKNYDTVESVLRSLQKENIFCRRYFYPSLSKLVYTNDNSTPLSDDIASKIMCLPMYYNLELENVEKICKIVESFC